MIGRHMPCEDGPPDDGAKGGEMMAWNPSPEVAVARDAAKAFDADMCVVIFVNAKKERIGYASYGANPALCAETKKMADRCYEAAKKWFEDQ